MSCRVLGRGVEEATLNLIAAEARRLGADRLIGEYRPTAEERHGARALSSAWICAPVGNARWGNAQRRTLQRRNLLGAAAARLRGQSGLHAHYGRMSRDGSNANAGAAFRHYAGGAG